jgi:tetratricopeptide (TPR) repeat protein
MISLRFPVGSAIVVLPSLLLLAGCRNANNYLEKGNAAFQRGQYDEASLNYRKAVQKDSNFGEAYYRAALAELKLNKAAEALEDLRQAVRLIPDNQPVREDLTNLMLGAYIGDPSHPKFLYDLLVQFSTIWL